MPKTPQANARRKKVIQTKYSPIKDFHPDKSNAGVNLLIMPQQSQDIPHRQIKTS